MAVAPLVWPIRGAAPAACAAAEAISESGTQRSTASARGTASPRPTGPSTSMPAAVQGGGERGAQAAGPDHGRRSRGTQVWSSEL